MRSRRSSALNKFATIAELSALSPVLHLSAVAGVLSLTLPLPLPGRAWIAGAALASLASSVIATVIVLVRHPHPGATVFAFARLPVYAAWRVSVAVRALVGPSAKEWRKTEHHSA